jgi:hypothetical protein
VYVGNSSSTSSASATVNGYLYNNEVILYPVTADNSYAVQLMSSNNLKVINNSLYIKSNAPYSNTAALMIQNNNNTYLDNNILMNYCNSGMGTQTNYPLYLNGTSTITGDNNDLISGSGLIAFKTVAINNNSELKDKVTEVLESEGPVVCEVFTPIGLTARPKQVSYKNSKGQMESLPLEYMNPPLPEDEFNENMIIPLFEKN